MSGKRTVTSEDGIQYDVLDTPGDVTFDHVVSSSPATFADDYRFHHVYVRSDQLRSLGLPLEANPREPTRGDVVKKMEETLRENPGRFHHWNNGITVICKSVQANSASTSLTATFSSGDGVCNGGHTYFAITTFPTALPDDCLVHLELIELPTALADDSRKTVINDIASRRNRNRQLLPTTQADYLGYYQPLKEFLGAKSEYVSWHEGDSDAVPDHIKSELLIRMLAVLDPFWYSHPEHSPTLGNHRPAATGSASVHRRWFDGVASEDPELSLYHMAPLIPAILELTDLIAFSLKHDNFTEVSPNWRATSFYKWIGERDKTLSHYERGEIGLALPNPMIVMMLGAFRSNVWLAKNEDGRPAFIGYLVDWKQLWDEAKCDLLRQLTSFFDDADRDPNHYIKNNAPYDRQLLSIVYGQRPPSLPVKLYSFADRKWFDRTGEPTHELLYADGYGTLSQVTVSGGQRQDKHYGVSGG